MSDEKVWYNDWVRGTFMGETAYVLRGILDGTLPESPIAPESHIKDGCLNFDTAFDTPTLAYVTGHGAVVNRHRKVLGELSDVFTVSKGVSHE